MHAKGLIINLIDDESDETVETEQVILDKHHDDISALPVRLESLSTTNVSITVSPPPMSASP